MSQAAVWSINVEEKSCFNEDQREGNYVTMKKDLKKKKVWIKQNQVSKIYF